MKISLYFNEDEDRSDLYDVHFDYLSVELD